MTEIAYKLGNLPWVEGEKLVGAKKCLGASTTVNRDIGDCLRSVEEVRGVIVSLGVKNALSDPEPGPWSRSNANFYLFI